tara:strand:+ start:272 stop:454 length:183 start_codon:yes stop_codon:yes gene_type:complete
MKHSNAKVSSIKEVGDAARLVRSIENDPKNYKKTGQDHWATRELTADAQRKVDALWDAAV